MMIAGNRVDEHIDLPSGFPWSVHDWYTMLNKRNMWICRGCTAIVVTTTNLPLSESMIDYSVPQTCKR